MTWLFALVIGILLAGAAVVAFLEYGARGYERQVATALVAVATIAWLPLRAASPVRLSPEVWTALPGTSSAWQFDGPFWALGGCLLLLFTAILALNIRTAQRGLPWTAMLLLVGALLSVAAGNLAVLVWSWSWLLLACWLALGATSAGVLPRSAGWLAAGLFLAWAGQAASGDQIVVGANWNPAMTRWLVAAAVVQATIFPVLLRDFIKRRSPLATTAIQASLGAAAGALLMSGASPGLNWAGWLLATLPLLGLGAVWYLKERRGEWPAPLAGRFETPSWPALATARQALTSAIVAVRDAAGILEGETGLLWLLALVVLFWLIQ